MTLELFREDNDIENKTKGNRRIHVELFSD